MKQPCATCKGVGTLEIGEYQPPDYRVVAPVALPCAACKGKGEVRP